LQSSIKLSPVAQPVPNVEVLKESFFGMPKLLFEEASSFGIERVEPMHYLYIVKSKVSGKYYIGESAHVESRMQKHINGKTAFGKRNRELELVYKQEVSTRGEAKKVEHFLKRQKSHHFINRFIAGKITIPR
jgi:predicted GIY-YIG superfamily endonuclease